MRAAFVRLGCTEAAATAIVDAQGIDDMEELRILKDDEVVNLCKVVRRPGGTIVVDGGDVPAPGENVSLRAENRIKLAAHWLRHQVRVSRTVAITDITLANIRTVRDLKDTEESYDNDPSPPTVDAKDWPKTMESIEEYFCGLHGVSNIPLGYIIRKEETVPEGDDPAEDYSTMQAEMIRRAPHRTGGEDSPYCETYKIDNVAVFDKLAAMTRDHECWTYVKPSQRTKNGRQAFLSLWNHYLGPNNVDNMASKAERKLAATQYFGEKKRWNFEKYVSLQKEQHTTLHRLEEHGYAGIDDRSKVRWLMDGIKTDALDSVKTNIMSNVALRSDFDGCVTLFKDFISQKNSSINPNINVSQVTTSEGANKKVRFGNAMKGKTGVEFRYYRTKEYNKLRKDQQDELREWRDSQGLRKGKKRKHEDDNLTSNVASLTKKIATLTRTVASMESRRKKRKIDDEVESDDSSSDDDDNNNNKGGNRGHPALTRQKRGK